MGAPGHANASASAGASELASRASPKRSARRRRFAVGRTRGGSSRSLKEGPLVTNWDESVNVHTEPEESEYGDYEDFLFDAAHKRASASIIG